MAYNLRSRIVRDALIEDDDAVEPFGGETSDSEEDNVCEQSEGSEYEESSENEDELENASLVLRLAQSRARGRPGVRSRTSLSCDYYSNHRSKTIVRCSLIRSKTN